jgi:hypothetical protein
MRLRLHGSLSREEVDLAQPGGLAGQAFALQEADEVDVIVRSRRIYVLHDAACTCRNAASVRGLNCRIQLDVLAVQQTARARNVVGGSGWGFGVLHGGRERLGALLRRRRVHPHDLPAVAVEVKEAA